MGPRLNWNVKICCSPYELQSTLFQIQQEMGPNQYEFKYKVVSIERDKDSWVIIYKNLWP